jgi:hypothetical protein
MVYGILPISHIYEYNAASLIDTENEHAPYIMYVILLRTVNIDDYMLIQLLGPWILLMEPPMFDWKTPSFSQL